MAKQLTGDVLRTACANDAFADGIRIDVELEPLSGSGSAVKPAVYEGGVYQQDRRWATSGDAEPTAVIVIDNTPSQANRLEAALRRGRESTGVPELVLDLTEVPGLPPHLPNHLSSLEFPHRNADAYLRDALLGDDDFIRTDLGRAIFDATAQECGPLVSWFPQALLYGFWQSHLGKKRANTKHARAWVSEIIGWQPATTVTRALGLKGDPLNLNTDDAVVSNPDDRVEWAVGGENVEGGKRDKLSEIGHGQVPFMGNDAAAAGVSFARITQKSSVSFAQLRRVSLGEQYTADADAAARALLVALGLHAHQSAFAGGFALRSGADLRPRETTATWLDSAGDEICEIGDAATTLALLAETIAHARSLGVPLDGWGQPPKRLTPKNNLLAAIRSTWPEVHG